jgi:hypothetical protein
MEFSGYMSSRQETRHFIELRNQFQSALLPQALDSIIDRNKEINNKLDGISELLKQFITKQGSQLCD